MLPLNAFSTKTCPATFAIDKVSVNVYTTLCIQMLDDNGCPLDVGTLTTPKPCVVPVPANPGAPIWDPTTWEDDMFGGGTPVDPADPADPPAPQTSEELPTDWVAVYRIKDTIRSNTVVASTAATTVDAAKGLFSVIITDDFIHFPGIFIAELAIYDELDVLRAVDRRYLQVSNNLSYEGTGAGPINITDIRMALWDTCPEQNTLLDDYEFPDDMIMSAIRRPIDMWNETPPEICMHSANTFPYRENWLRATCGFLLKTAAHKVRRNALPYSAGGLSVNDQNKFNEYDAAGSELIGMYREWVARKKLELNMSRGFGIYRSGY
jgi:hypothetical protein